MGALTAARVPPRQEVWHQRVFTLLSGKIAYAGGLCVIKDTDDTVEPATTGGNQILIGLFAETVDASSTGHNADWPVNVQLLRPVHITWLDNDTGTAVASTDLGGICYLLDDHTVTGSSGGSASKAGRVWGVATINGVASVAVELFAPAVGDS